MAPEYATGSISFSTLSDIDMAVERAGTRTASEANLSQNGTSRPRLDMLSEPPRFEDEPDELLVQQARDAEVGSLINELTDNEELSKDLVDKLKKQSRELRNALESLAKSKNLVDKYTTELNKLSSGKYPPGVTPFKMPFTFQEAHTVFTDQDRTFSIRIPANTTYAGAKHILYMEYLALDRTFNRKCAEARVVNMQKACNLNDFIDQITKPVDDISVEVDKLGLGLPPGLFGSNRSLSKVKGLEIYKSLVTKVATDMAEQKQKREKDEADKTKVVKYLESRSPSEMIEMKVDRRIDMKLKRNRKVAVERDIRPPQDPSKETKPPSLDNLYDIDWSQVKSDGTYGPEAIVLKKKKPRKRTKKQLAERRHNRQGEGKTPEDGGKVHPRHGPKKSPATKKKKEKSKGKGKGKGEEPMKGKGKGKGKGTSSTHKGKGKGKGSQKGSWPKGKGKVNGRPWRPRRDNPWSTRQ